MAEKPKKVALPIVDGKDQDGKTIRIGIVQAIFNRDITDQQYSQAVQCMSEFGVEHDIKEVYGSYEITYLIQQMAKSNKYDGIVALGCLIRGETIHFEVVSQAVALAISDLIKEYNLPIGFGIITANSREQAQARIWFGYDATYAVLDSIIKARSI